MSINPIAMVFCWLLGCFICEVLIAVRMWWSDRRRSKS